MSSEVIAIPQNPGLTKYPSGSVRELWSLSFPLMLSLMSGSLMLFFDRLLLAHFSVDALNASTNASIIAAAIQFGFISTACIAEVFVGRYNGAGRLDKLGTPVWQMIWFSLATSLIFLPVALFLGPFLFSETPYAALEEQYFLWVMAFGPVFCLVAALSSFYIGRGSVAFVTLLVILANLINVGLDLVLIFGYEPLGIPPVGVAGAAIATGISQTVQAVILFLAFISKKNRERFGTGNYQFVWKACKKCLKIGLPNSLAHTLEIMAWAVFFRMMTLKGADYITVAAISQSIFFLFTFITEGISKGATAIAANMIGAKKWDDVWKLLRSGVRFYFQVFLVLGSVLVIYPEPLIQIFLTDNNELSQSVLETTRSACVWIWVFFLFDGINWLVVGLLTAAGDTKFILKAGGTTVWLFAILPIYIFVFKLGFGADVAWELTAVYGFLTCCIYLWRFNSQKWKRELVA